MGSINRERWRPIDWRAAVPTIGQMRALGWSIISHCPICSLDMPVNLDDLIALRGPEMELWNKRPRCRRIGCRGQVQFQARPPGLGSYFTLEADYPSHENLTRRGQKG